MAEIAVIKTGGKQYKVAEGDVLKVEKLSDKEQLEFTDVLEGKKVIAKILENGRYPKVRVLKFKPKKRYKRANGHIQEYSSIRIESIK